MDNVTPYQLIKNALDAMQQAAGMLNGEEFRIAVTAIEKAAGLLDAVVPVLSDITIKKKSPEPESIAYTPEILDIEELLKPIPGDNPAGVNARISGEVNNLLSYVVNRTRASDFRPQYSELLTKAKQLISVRSKDLGVAVRLIEAAVEESGFMAIADGLLLINGMFTNFWEGLYPESEDGDCEARANELTKLEELLLTRVCARYGQPHEFTPSCSDLSSAEKECALFRFIMEQLDQLDKITAERFDDQAPDLSELRSMLKIFQNRIDAQCYALRQELQQQQDAARREQEMSIAAAAEAVDRESERQKAASEKTDTAVISLEPADMDDALSRLDTCANYFITNASRDPLGYLLHRNRKWFSKIADSSAGSLSEERRQKIIEAFTIEQWDEVIKESEAAFMEGGHRWIDLQRYLITAASRSGPDYSSVAQYLSAAAADFVSSNRGLLDAKMDDGTPCASPETIEWIRMEIANRGGRGSGAGFGGKSDTFYVSEIERADELSAKGKPGAGMGLIHSRLQQASSRREQFLWRIALAEYSLRNNLTEIALAAIDHLVETADKLNLGDWEDPELFVRIFKAGYAGYRSLGEKKAPPEKLNFFYRRICLYDPKHTISTEN